MSQDNHEGWGSTFGVSRACFTSSNASAAAASITDAPDSGKKLVITDVFVSVDAAMRVDIKEETTGTVLLSGYYPANTPPHQMTPRSKLKLATADKKLQVQTSASGNITVTVFYFSEA